MLSTTILSGGIILNYFFDISTLLSEDATYKRIHAVAGVILISTGILNIFLIKAGK